MGSAVTDVTVESDSGLLVVRWSVAGDDPGVDVGIGQTPDTGDHVHTASVDAGCREVRLTWPGGRRPYVSVAPRGGGETVVAAERRVPFSAVTNFRDLGGYPTSDGRRTRWGQVYRSDGLHNLAPREMEAYEALGVRAVYDLRGDVERERHPDPVPSAHLPLLSAAAGARPAEPDTSIQDATWGEERLHLLYRGLLSHAGPMFGRLFEGLATPGGLPAVVHCTGGKDRTGVGAALLLELLGVPRDQVLDDYVLTARFRRREHQTESYETMLASGIPPEAAVGVLGAPRWAMAETLRELDEDHGGVEAYLKGAAGLSAPVLERLRSLLLS